MTDTLIASQAALKAVVEELTKQKGLIDSVVYPYPHCRFKANRGEELYRADRIPPYGIGSHLLLPV